MSWFQGWYGRLCVLKRDGLLTDELKYCSDEFIKKLNENLELNSGLTTKEDIEEANQILDNVIDYLKSLEFRE